MRHGKSLVWLVSVGLAMGVGAVSGWAQTESAPAATKPSKNPASAQPANPKPADAKPETRPGVKTADTPATTPAPTTTPAPAKEGQPSGAGDAPNLVNLEGLKRLSKDREVWVDVERQRVIVGGKVCLNRGMLEMFACPRGTKEHESIVSLNAKAYEIHAALLAVGAKPGRPVRYQPEYQAAEGEVIKVDVQWRDAEGKPHSVPAQQWIRQVKSGEPMTQDWVFAGSGFWKDTATGKEHYLAEGGEVICVSNFGTALLDLPIQSSQDNADLMFEAFTDHIPPLETPIRVILSRVPAPAKR
ncbi:MAG: YdjY domain-containing protein [Pirellulales bacterium]